MKYDGSSSIASEYCNHSKIDGLIHSNFNNPEAIYCILYCIQVKVINPIYTEPLNWLHCETAYACDLNDITQRSWISIYAPIPELWKSIEITDQMPSRFYIIPLHVNLISKISFYNSFNVTYQNFAACWWVCATIVFDSGACAAVACSAIFIVVKA